MRDDGRERSVELREWDVWVDGEIRLVCRQNSIDDCESTSNQTECYFDRKRNSRVHRCHNVSSCVCDAADSGKQKEHFLNGRLNLLRSSRTKTDRYGQHEKDAQR